jgi:hypothetical protein
MAFSVGDSVQVLPKIKDERAGEKGRIIAEIAGGGYLIQFPDGQEIYTSDKLTPTRQAE